MKAGKLLLSRVVIPEYVIVHDGSPRDSTATNYYVKYKDYIKMLHQVKYMRHGQRMQLGQMCWQLCLLR